MPHVVLDKKINLKKFCNEFQNLSINKPIIKITNIFLDKLERTALLPTTVIESNTNQHFLIEINVKDNKTTIRLYPGTDPEKTKGVKMFLGLLANKLLRLFPYANIAKTNIQNFIDESK